MLREGYARTEFHQPAALSRHRNSRLMARSVPNRKRTHSLHDAGRSRLGFLKPNRAGFPAERLLATPKVRIQSSPPTSLRFEAFSGEVRKLRACSGDARGPSAPESGHTVSRCASLRFSLCGRVIRSRCPLSANATSEQEPPISLSMRQAPRASGWEKSVGLRIIS